MPCRTEPVSGCTGAEGNGTGAGAGLLLIAAFQIVIWCLLAERGAASWKSHGHQAVGADGANACECARVEARDRRHRLAMQDGETQP